MKISNCFEGPDNGEADGGGHDGEPDGGGPDGEPDGGNPEGSAFRLASSAISSSMEANISVN